MKLSKTISELVQISENTCALEEQSLDITVPAFDEGIPIDTDDSGPSKTALIAVHYGGYNEIRKNATTRAVQEWDSQQIKPDDGIFIELTYPGESPCFSQSDFPKWIRYMRIYGKERNRNLFQKEALWNLATKYTDADKLFFLDADCMPVNCKTYFQQIFNACTPGKCVHAAWHIIHENQPPDSHDFYTVFSNDPSLNGKPRFPGIGYCLTRHDFHKMDGFNPYSICGSGDVVFLMEMMKGLDRHQYVARLYHTALLRPDQPQLTPVAVPGIDVQHNFHGYRKDRAYIWSRYLVEIFGTPKAYCHIDSAGLIAWNDPIFPLKYMVMQKNRMHTKNELLALIYEVFKQRLDEQELLNKNPNYCYDKTDGNIFD